MMSSVGLCQFILYFFVGAGATVVEWGTFYLFDVTCKMHYAFATSLAFVISTFANWFLGRVMVFSKGDVKGIVHEIIAIYGVSCMGLAANLVIMFICISWLLIPDMLAKIIATGIVFAGNFFVRKFWIYKEK